LKEIDGYLHFGNDHHLGRVKVGYERETDEADTQAAETFLRVSGRQPQQVP
jgi:hypothetical protein